MAPNISQVMQQNLFSNDMLFVPLILILLFVVFVGVFVVYLGFRKRKTFRGFIHLYANIEKIHLPTLDSTISWSYKGIKYYALSSGVHAISRKERVRIFLHPQSMKYYLDIWTHNGKGQILGGFLISFLGGLALLLFLLGS